jgi:flagellar motility protein MotE (MotC chaperone)
MMRWVREFRLIPVVLIAVVCLFALKTLGLFLDGRYTLGGLIGGSAQRGAPPPKAASPPGKPPAARVVEAAAPASDRKRSWAQSWAQEAFNRGDITGSVEAHKPPEKPHNEEGKPQAGAKPPPIEPKRDPGGTLVPLEGSGKPVSPAERVILEHLQERRQELDARARELEVRENLLKAAERRVEERVTEMKEIEARISSAMQQKEEMEASRLKSLVTMYENMKPKDAAKIFDRLDLKVLLDVSSQINPRRMSDILAQMQPEAAEHLTVELANRAKPHPEPTLDLPKIEGHRTGN